MLKKIATSIILCITILTNLIYVQAYTDSLSQDVQIMASLGMLKGDERGITAEYVNAAPTRLQAAILYLRLKGLESSALNFKGIVNFADANDISWSGGKSIMAYLKAHPELGWQGDGTNFNPQSIISAKEYYKVMLETLGYKQTKEGILGDFTWNNVTDLANKLGMGKVAYVSYFTISDLATATVEALKTKIKEDDKSLINKLVDSGIISAEKLSLLSSELSGLSILSGVVTSETSILVNLRENISEKLATDASQYKVTINNTNVVINSLRYDEKTKKSVLTVDLKGKTGTVKVNGIVMQSAINLSSMKILSTSGINSVTYAFYVKLSDYPMDTITGKKLLLVKDMLKINATCISVNGKEALFEVDTIDRTKLQNGIYIINMPADDAWATIEGNIIIYPALSIQSVGSISSSDCIFTVTLSEYPISSLVGKKLVLQRNNTTINATYLNISNLKVYFGVDEIDKSKLTDGIYTVSTPENDRWAFISGKTTNYSVASSYISVSNANYNINTGKLTLSGNGFRGVPGTFNDITSSKITVGNGINSYTLVTTPNVEVTNNYYAELTLSDEDIIQVNSLFSQNGYDDGISKVYNIALADGWNGEGSIADLINPIYVSGFPTPTISNVTYNCNTGIMVLTGSNFKKVMGQNNDITTTKLTIYVPNDKTYNLTTSLGSEIADETSVTLTIMGKDRAELNSIFDKNGSQNSNNQPYYLNANAGWNGAESPADNITNTITVTSIVEPEIKEAVYNYTTGIFSVSGTGFKTVAGANNDIDVQKIIISAIGGASYCITSNTQAVEVVDSTTFMVTLSAIDKQYINGILDKNGEQNTSNQQYNIAVLSNWNGTGSAEDLLDNPITVTSYISPSISNAIYNCRTGLLTINGTNLRSIPGTNNDIIPSYFTITDGSKSYTLTAATASVDVINTTTATILVNGIDRAMLNWIFTANGDSNGMGGGYHILATDNWNGIGTSSDILNNKITVSDWAAPEIINAVYNRTTNLLTIAGNNLRAVGGVNNDIDATAFTVSDGVDSYRLTDINSSVDITDHTTIIINISTVDEAGVEAVLSAVGSQSAPGRIYNIRAEANWNLTGSLQDISNNPITVIE